jgi:outer membrane protein assembly factor BamD (BamD/ComL family)
MIGLLPKPILALLTILSTLNSCVQQSEYDKLKAENQSLKTKLDESENGAVRLLSQAQSFAQNGELEQAQHKLKILFERHGETNEAAQGRVLLTQIQLQKKKLEEATFWENSSANNSLESYENYLASYPDGQYASLARRSIENLKAEKEKNDFDLALNSNNASTVREFISIYPNHPSVSKFKKRLIELEVDEIFGNSNTGRLPSIEQVGSEYSATSSISIRNDTGCELIVRYSGADVRMIEIASGATKAITLSSGSYRIAASACGANYAGTEQLHGTYSSSYYISRY